MKIYKTYQFRMYPSDEQKRLIHQNFGCARFVFNYLLEQKRKNNSLSKFDVIKQITLLKEQYSFLKEADSTSLQNVVTDLINGYKKYYNKQAGIPHFKKKGDKESYRTTCIRSSYKENFYSNIKVDLVNKEIILPKLGRVSIRGYRNKYDFDYKIINATVKQEAGRYYVCVLVEEEKIINTDTNYKTVGIDLGVKNLVVTSDLKYYGNTSNFNKHEKRIAKLQQSLAKKQKESKNYQKTLLKLERAYQKLKNSRKKQAEEIVAKLVKTNDIIIAESLKVKSMIEQGTKSLRKNILHSTFSLILTKLKYQCDWQGKQFYQISPYYPSSQLCCNCGSINENMKNLNNREYICSHCGIEVERDFNASLNILFEGLKKFATKEI